MKQTGENDLSPNTEASTQTSKIDAHQLRLALDELSDAALSKQDWRHRDLSEIHACIADIAYDAVMAENLTEEKEEVSK